MLTLNEIYYGDCLQIMREIDKGSINLIYIDPPFGDNNLDKKFGIKWNADNEQLQWFDRYFGLSVKNINKKHQLSHYLHFMHERLVLMRDLLTEDGSIYVHCDHRVTGYLRLILDEIFGKDNFVNEVIWGFEGHAEKETPYFKRKHNTIFLYQKTEHKIFNVQYASLSESTINRFGGYFDDKGQITYRYMKEHNPGVYEQLNKRGKHNLDDVWLDKNEGKPMLDWWSDISIIRKGFNEKLDYPTQKPEMLLERIIKASSNEGDLVADLFCGAGTTLAVALKLNRKWIGVDSNFEAVEIARKRIANERKQLKLDFCG